MPKSLVIDIYERHAEAYDRERERTLFERPWLDRFLEQVQPLGTILDIGCGMAEPIAAYFREQGVSVVGVDSSPSLIARCRARFPEGEWKVGDMRQLNLDRRFAGVIAWDSFFHLDLQDQRRMFPRFARHALPGSPLMFTSGPYEGEVVGSYHGEPLYHASLSPQEYEQLLLAHGFQLMAQVSEDPECGGHTVWLARFLGE